MKRQKVARAWLLPPLIISCVLFVVKSVSDTLENAVQTLVPQQLQLQLQLQQRHKRSIVPEVFVEREFMQSNIA